MKNICLKFLGAIKNWQAWVSIFSVAAMITGYGYLSYRQHLPENNPHDTTIPTWSQFMEGFQKIVKANRKTFFFGLALEQEKKGIWGEIYHSAFETERWIIDDSVASGYRLLAGLFFGLFLGVVIGVLMGRSKFIKALFILPLTFLSSIPPVGALPVFFALAGTGDFMYIAMIAMGIFPALGRTVYFEVRDVPEELTNKALTLGASYCEVIWNVVFRYLLPKIIDAIVLQIAPAIVYLIAAEMVCGSVGFGYRMRIQGFMLNMNVVYTYLAFLAIGYIILCYGIKFLQKKYFPWYFGKEGE